MKVTGKFVPVLAGVCLLLFMPTAMVRDNYEPFGNYSSVGFSLFRTTYANSGCVSDCHEVYGGSSLNLSYQLILNMVVGLKSMSGQSQDNVSTVKSLRAGLFVGLVMGVGSAFDIGGLLSPVSARSETCLGALCTNSEESGTNVGLMGKWWIVEANTFNLGLNFDSYSYTKSSTKYSSSALLFSYLPYHHELYLMVSKMKDSTGTDFSSTINFGYNYQFRLFYPN